jgi:hypothetical protein
MMPESSIGLSDSVGAWVGPLVLIVIVNVTGELSSEPLAFFPSARQLVHRFRDQAASPTGSGKARSGSA